MIDKEYKLPDGQTIIVGRERFEAPEILMNPSLIDDESEDCATMIYNATIKNRNQYENVTS